MRQVRSVAPLHIQFPSALMATAHAAIVAFTLVLTLLGGTNAVPMSGDAATAILAQMNRVRAGAGAPPLVWDAGLADWAGAWADTCQFAHRPSNPYGENVCGSTDVNLCMKLWVDNEFPGWQAQGCPRLIDDPNWGQHAHYTAIIWPSTTSVGCGYRDGCNLVCNFAPMGNYNNEVINPYRACAAITTGPFSFAAAAWTPVWGRLVGISVKGGQVWGWDAGGHPYQWVQGWRTVAGWVSGVSAAADGWAWAIGQGSYIFRYNPGTGSFENIPGILRQVDGYSRDRAVGTNWNNEIYFWNGATWIQLAGAATWASIGANDEIWVVSLDGKPYRWNGSGFQLMPGWGIVHIAVNSPTEIVCSTIYQTLYRWNGETWVNIGGIASYVGVSGSQYWAVAADGNIFNAGNGVTRAVTDRNAEMSMTHPHLKPGVVVVIVVVAVVVAVALIVAVAVVLHHRRAVTAPDTRVPLVPTQTSA